MGAQERGSWLELPFWRMVKYYLLCVLTGILIGVTLSLVGFYTSTYHKLAVAALNFLTTYWWVTPSTIGILSVIIYFKRPKRKKEVETERTLKPSQSA